MSIYVVETRFAINFNWEICSESKLLCILLQKFCRSAAKHTTADFEYTDFLCKYSAKKSAAANRHKICTKIRLIPMVMYPYSDLPFI